MHTLDRDWQEAFTFAVWISLSTTLWAPNWSILFNWLCTHAHVAVVESACWGHIYVSRWHVENSVEGSRIERILIVFELGYLVILSLFKLRKDSTVDVMVSVVKWEDSMPIVGGEQCWHVDEVVSVFLDRISYVLKVKQVKERVRSEDHWREFFIVLLGLNKFVVFLTELANFHSSCLRFCYLRRPEI